MNPEANCVFCKIVKSKIDADLILSDEFCFVINDINPVVVNQGDDAGQEIEHFHMHLLAGKKIGFPSV